MTTEIAGNKPSLEDSQEAGLSEFLAKFKTHFKSNCHTEDTVYASNLVTSLPYKVKCRAFS